MRGEMHEFSNKPGERNATRCEMRKIYRIYYKWDVSVTILRYIKYKLTRDLFSLRTCTRRYYNTNYINFVISCASNHLHQGIFFMCLYLEIVIYFKTHYLKLNVLYALKLRIYDYFFVCVMFM